MTVADKMETLLADHVHALGATFRIDHSRLCGMCATVVVLPSGEEFVVELPDDATETDIMFGAQLLLRQAKGAMRASALTLGDGRVDQPAASAPVQGAGPFHRSNHGEGAGW